MGLCAARVPQNLLALLQKTLGLWVPYPASWVVNKLAPYFPRQIVCPHAGTDTGRSSFAVAGETAALCFPYLLFVCYLQGEKPPEEEEPQPALAQNGSPRLNRVEFASQQPPEVYDVRLQRKENEGFGFVILTSKNKPPPGGKCCVLAAWSLRGARAAANISRHEPGCGICRAFSLMCCCYPQCLSLPVSWPSQLRLCLASYLCSGSANCDVSESRGSIFQASSPCTGTCTCHRAACRTWSMLGLWW